jgi:hypothetical protein
MTDLTDLQRQLLVAALRARGCITVVVTADGDVSVRAGSKRVCGSATPLEGLVAAQLLNLIGAYEDKKATRPGAEIRGVRLYELTSAGRAFALDVEIGPRWTPKTGH